jgi:phosphate transport system permease protein
MNNSVNNHNKFTNFSEFYKSSKAQKLIKKRHRKERVFKKSGIIAIFISISFLFILIANVSIKSRGAFTQTKINLPISFTAEILDIDEEYESLEDINFKQVLMSNIKLHFPNLINNRREKIKIYRFFSSKATQEIKEYYLNNPDIKGKTANIWLTTNSNIDQYLKGHRKKVNSFYQNLLDNEFNDKIAKHLSFNLFKQGDSTNPETAGIRTALIGSIFTMFIFLMIAFPLAVLLALYLEEFAKKNKFTDFIEININNLAAIPSIIFGLLGLSIFINTFQVPRSSSYIGGITLALLVLPVIVIATRNSIKSVPQTIKDAALALGASPIQVALQHTLPISLPGILTGTILAVTRAIGETAPLLMIGMIAFIVDKPDKLSDPTTVLPVQIYLWANNPETGFAEKTSATILILLAFLLSFNLIAILLRNKYSQKIN